jgi:hypothetical protein
MAPCLNCVVTGRPTTHPGHLTTPLRSARRNATCASLWLGAVADPKVVQRILGHASAAMTMDLYGHLIGRSLWDSTRGVGGLSFGVARSG